MNSKEMMALAYKALEDKKGINTTVIDISDISILADYFIISSGDNDNQVRALSDNVEDCLSKENMHPNHIEGYSNAEWILMDFGSIIVHIFNEKDRSFYDLERIWRDGNILSKNDVEQLSIN